MESLRHGRLAFSAEGTTLTWMARERAFTPEVLRHGVVIALDSRYASRAGYRVALGFEHGEPMRLYAPILSTR